MGQIIYYLTRYYSSTGSAAAALIVSIKQPPLSLSVSNYAIIGFLLSSTQLRKTLDFCYHESVTHAGISSYGRVKYVRILTRLSLRRCTDRCPGASNLGLLEYRSILYPCINQLVIVCVEIFAQKECYIDDAANILVLITAIY